MSPTGFGLLQRLCRFGLGLGDFWISARLNALLDDAEFGRGQAARKLGAASTAAATSVAWASMNAIRSPGLSAAKCDLISAWIIASPIVDGCSGVRGPWPCLWTWLQRLRPIRGRLSPMGTGPVEAPLWKKCTYWQKYQPPLAA